MASIVTTGSISGEQGRHVLAGAQVAVGDRALLDVLVMTDGGCVSRRRRLSGRVRLFLGG